MLAVAWPWSEIGRDRFRGISTRLGASLCAGIGGHAGGAEIDRLPFAYRPLRSTAASAKAWRPAILLGGRVAVFHGYFDNASAIAGELGQRTDDLARLYGVAVDRW